MRTFSATYTDAVTFNRKPNEDYFLASEKYPIFSVADGVTRYVAEDLRYSYPAGARAAAQIFCQSILEYLEKEFEKGANPQEETIREALNFANDRIREMNENEGMTKSAINYRERDFFDCVGVAATISRSALLYGYLSDCGLALFNKNNELLFQTENTLKPIIAPYMQMEDVRERRELIKKELRNNSNGSGYGAFTGEQEAALYYRIGTVRVHSEDLIVLYSDGFEPYFQFPEFVNLLRKGNTSTLDAFSAQKAKENPETFGSDRTVLSILIS